VFVCVGVCWCYVVLCLFSGWVCCGFVVWCSMLCVVLVGCVCGCDCLCVVVCVVDGSGLGVDWCWGLVVYVGVVCCVEGCGRGCGGCGCCVFLGW
jgi:hypothetical protein